MRSDLDGVGKGVGGDLEVGDGGAVLLLLLTLVALEEVGDALVERRLDRDQSFVLFHLGEKKVYNCI